MLRSEILKDRKPDITNLATNTSLNGKINEVKNEISSITNLYTTAVTTVEDKIPSFSDLVKIADYDAEIKDIKINISPHLIIISSEIIYLMTR